MEPHKPDDRHGSDITSLIFLTQIYHMSHKSLIFLTQISHMSHKYITKVSWCRINLMTVTGATIMSHLCHTNISHVAHTYHKSIMCHLLEHAVENLRDVVRGVEVSRETLLDQRVQIHSVMCYLGVKVLGSIGKTFSELFQRGEETCFSVLLLQIVNLAAVDVASTAFYYAVLTTVFQNVFHLQIFIHHPLVDLHPKWYMMCDRY